MSVLKKTGIVVGALVVGLAGGTVGLWYYLGHAGPNRLEQWIGRQIVSVLEGYVTPRIEFTTLDYQAPRTVVIDGLKFTVEDRPILALDRIVLTLAEIPREGQPILIERVEATRPHLQFVTDGDRGLIGWSHFVRPDVRRNPPPAGRRFSDILVLQYVSIADGQILYDDLGDSSDPMTLPGIELKLNTPKLADQPGWYQLAGVFERMPIFHVDVNGRINLDTGLLDLAKLDLKAAMGPDQYSTLPPQAQRFLREHEVQGMLTASVQGQIPLADPVKSTASIRADMQNARFAYAGLTVPVDRMQFEARMPEGPAKLNLARVTLGAGARSFLTLKGLGLAVGRLPTSGGPVEIDNLEIDEPRVAFIRDPAGGFLGWNQLRAATSSSASPERERGGENGNVETSKRRNVETTDNSATPTTSPAAAIAQAVVLKGLQIRDAGFSYAASPDAKPAGIEGIDLMLRTQPQADGTFQVDGTLKREPLFTGQVAARADLNAGIIHIQKVSASGKLSPADYAALPAQAMSLLQQHGVEGQFTASAEGRVPLRAPAEAEGRAEVELKDVAFNFEGIRIPVRQARLQAELPDGGVHVSAEGLAMESADVSMMTVERAAVDLAALPQAGRPLQLDRVALDRPRFRFIRTDSGELAGWSRLKDAMAATPPRDFVLKQLQATDAGGLYEAPGQRPIALEGINVDASAVPDQGGIITKGRLKRDRLIDFTWDGRLDRDKGILDLADARLAGRLDRRDYEALPKGMRATLEAYGLLGQFTANWRGRIPLGAPAQSTGELDVEVKDGRAIYNGSTFTVARLQGGGKLPDGRLVATAEDFRITRGEQRLMAARRINLELPWPRAGSLLQISKLDLDRPDLRLVERKEGGFVGWSELAGVPGAEPREGRGDAQPPGRSTRQPERSAEAGPRAEGQAERNRRPESQRDGTNAERGGGSAVPIFSALRIRDGRFIYRPADAPEMVVTGIDLNADARLRQDRLESYAINGNLRGEDGRGDVRFEARLSPADWLLEVNSLSGRTALDEAHAAMLPPGVQSFIRDHQMRGQLHIRGQARVPLRDTDRTTAEWEAELRDARLAVGASIWPVNQLITKGRLADSRLRVDFSTSLLGGSASGALDYTVTGSRPLQLSWSANGLQLERTLEVASGQPSQYSGTLNSTGQLSARGAAFRETLSGNGSLSVSNGQLVNVPLIHEILVVASARALRRAEDRRADSAQVSFELRPDAIAITQGQLDSPLIKLTGSGRVGYDSTLDLRLRANVLQGVQRMEREITGGLDRLGRAIGGRGVGRILGDTIGPAGQAVTRLADNIVVYRVTGTTSRPRVVPEPLGLGR